MQISSRILFLLLVIVTVVAARKLPSGMTQCSVNEPDLNACILKNGRKFLMTSVLFKGIPSYGIPPFDPLHVNEIRVEDPGISRSVSMDLTMYDIDIKGLNNVTFHRANVSLEKNFVHWHFSVPRLYLIGRYEVKGRVLLLPISGFGRLNVSIDDLHFSYSYNLVRGIIGKDGKEYLGVKDNRVDFNVRQRAYFDLENLFNGNKEISAQLNVFLNENWIEMIGQVGPPVAEALNMFSTQLMVNLQKLVPFEEIFKDVPSVSRKKSE